MTGTQKPMNTSTKLHRIAEVARKYPNEGLKTLSKYLDEELLEEAYRRTRKDGATGVDGQTASAYAEHLPSNLEALARRAHTGSYRAPPVRRTYIPKASGGQMRPIGIPTFEDKILQRAVQMLLEPIYEQEFAEFSYGFRPNRSAHQALQALWDGVMRMGGGWVVELDIKSYFDTVNHSILRELVQRRVKDGVLRRLLGKWLKAGVVEEGSFSRPELGTPQGGVISPMLANIYLHYVLDCWWRDDIVPRTRGQAFMIRYADDAVMVFSHRSEAQRFLEVLPKRFERFGLTLHPGKTRLVRFIRPQRKGRGKSGPRPGSFDFLGFTHYWGRSRKGRPVVKRKTGKGRLRHSLKRISLWLRKVMHRPVKWQHHKLSTKVRGHYAYYGITGNARCLQSFLTQVERTWRKWLNRRSWRTRMNWEKFKRLLDRYPLPAPRVVHSVYR